MSLSNSARLACAWLCCSIRHSPQANRVLTIQPIITSKASIVAILPAAVPVQHADRLGDRISTILIIYASTYQRKSFLFRAPCQGLQWLPGPIGVVPDPANCTWV